jgi:hypothetical protein
MIEGRKHNPDFPKTRRGMALKLNKAGGPIKLAKELNLSKVTIHNWMNHYGVELVNKYK